MMSTNEYIIDSSKLLIYIGVMAGVTYLIRMLPLALFRKKIQNRFFRSFLFYVPYSVLAAMTFPGILYCTSSILSAIVGLVVGCILAIREKGLVMVAIAACSSVFIVEFLLGIGRVA